MKRVSEIAFEQLSGSKYLLMAFSWSASSEDSYAESKPVVAKVFGWTSVLKLGSRVSRGNSSATGSKQLATQRLDGVS